MKREIFAEYITKLEHAFSKRLDKKTISIYFEYLGHLDDALFISKCDNLIVSERFFPAISCFYKKEDAEDQFSGAI